MERYNWYTVRETLKILHVESGWLSSSDLMTFRGPHRVAVMRKANNIRPETLVFLLDELDIDADDFKRAYKSYMA